VKGAGRGSPTSVREPSEGMCEPRCSNTPRPCHTADWYPVHEDRPGASYASSSFVTTPAPGIRRRVLFRSKPPRDPTAHLARRKAAPALLEWGRRPRSAPTSPPPRRFWCGARLASMPSVAWGSSLWPDSPRRWHYSSSVGSSGLHASKGSAKVEDQRGFLP